MKQVLIVTSLVVLHQIVHAQIRFNHHLRQNMINTANFVLLAPDVVGGTPNTTVQLCKMTKGIINVSSGKITFDPWQETIAPPCGAIPNGVTMAIFTPLELKDGRQTVGNPTRVLTVPFRAWTLGLNTIPFRFRSKRTLADTVKAYGTVTSSFSLALSFGPTFGYSRITTRSINNYSITGSVFVGPSSIDIKKETVTEPDKIVAAQTNAALSYGAMITLARNNLGIVLAVGLEKALGKNGNLWIYDSKPWFGFGVNTSFLK